jgi:hypothetical protein
MSKWKRFVIVASVFSVAMTFDQPSARAEVTTEKTGRGVAIKMDGQLFTEYLTTAGQSPAMWPIIGPTGQEMTRAFPLRPSPKGKYDTDDHPHHQSLWFTHDQVNGADFWKENVNPVAGLSEAGSSGAGVSDPGHNKGAHVAHREFVKVRSDGDTATLVTRNDWMNGAKRICADERTVVFGTRENGDRWIDFTITLKATDGDVTFGDTKEGTFAIRVPDPMRVEAKLGGKITNSEDQTNEAAWGQPAKWVDYTGPVTVPNTESASAQAAREVSGVRDQVSDSKSASNSNSDTRHLTPDTSISGIAILSHPNSFRPTPRWHVRTYGLFAANPFGQRDFPNPEAAKQGATTIQNGDSLTLRYLVLFHRGKTNTEELNAAFEEFAAK